MRVLPVAWSTACVVAGLLAMAPAAPAAGATTADEARAAHWKGSYLEHEDAVRELAAHGAPVAVLPVLRAHERADEARLRILAQALLYEHAARLGVDQAERERLRQALMTTAEDRKAPGTARNEAMRVLMAGAWDGRDAWYEARLGDPTLRDPSDGVNGYSPLGWPLETEPDRWVPRLIPKLARAGDVRSNVAHVLAQLADREARDKKPPRRDVAVALLPWLADGAWARGSNWSPSPRAGYISSLERLHLPEALPGLIHVVETETDYVGARAAGALEHLRDPRALPALRKALPAHLDVQWERQAFLRAIRACGGEQPLDALVALQAYARAAATPEGLEQVRGSIIHSPKPLDQKVAIGIDLAHGETADDRVVAQVIAALPRSRPPAVAFALEAPLFAWTGRAAQLHVVSRLADRDPDDRLLRLALDGRNVLAASVGPELRALLARGGTGAGRAAAVLEDRAAIGRVLAGSDVPAILGLLHASVVSNRRGLDETMDWNLGVRGGVGGSIRLAAGDVGPLLARNDADVVAAARAWLTGEGGPTAKAWLAANGKLARAPADEIHAYSVAGVAAGMKRAAVERLAARGVDIQYDAQGSATIVQGNSLRDGAREIVTPASRAGDVRRLFGRPDREHSDHVFATVGGFFWHYERAGVVIVLSFTDDNFTLNDQAPLYEVTLLDPATYRARFPKR
jgi:hypothetical protein